MKKSYKKFSLALSVALMLSAVVVQAHSRVDYTLPVYGAKNNYHGTVNSKTTSNMFVLNHIYNDYDSFDTITCWVSDKNKKKISKSYYLSEGEGAFMNHNKVSKVRLSFENSSWSTFSAKVGGYVDYY